MLLEIKIDDRWFEVVEERVHAYLIHVYPYGEVAIDKEEIEDLRYCA